MSLLPGSRLGPYEIVAPIGAGGMGEVYRATDSHLKRAVAVKVLPASLGADALRLARFQREAEMLAALNHPNIAQIYGLEKTPELTALVMELVDGKELSELIAAGALHLQDALAIARQIADALEAAHEQGIVHRDLKPQNIRVRADGAVKVLDFGLAKAFDGDSSSSAADSHLSHSPTMSRQMTEVGMILGTAAYMAPEQAKGKAVDKRADVWAFGVVLHEMLSGRHLFRADSIPETLAHVLTRPTDLGALPATTPHRVRDLIARCLEKDPKKRLRDIGEARILLGTVTGGADEEPTGLAQDPGQARAGSPWSVALPWTIAAVTIAAAGWTYLKSGPATESSAAAVTYLDIGSLPDVESVRLSNGGYAVSPDGRTVAIIGVKGGARRLFIRRLGRPEAEELPARQGRASPARRCRCCGEASLASPTAA